MIANIYSKIAAHLFEVYEGGPRLNPGLTRLTILSMGRLLENIRLARKNLPKTNTLAYFAVASASKKFSLIIRYGQTNLGIFNPLDLVLPEPTQVNPGLTSIIRLG